MITKELHPVSYEAFNNFAQAFAVMRTDETNDHACTELAFLSLAYVDYLALPFDERRVVWLELLQLAKYFYKMKSFLRSCETAC